MSVLSALRLCSRIISTLGSKNLSQKQVAPTAPIRSPTIHSPQYLSPSQSLSLNTAMMDAQRMRAGLTMQPGGANWRPMWMKATMKINPESSLSMKVVLGLEICSRENTSMKVPMISAKITRKHSFTVSSQGIGAGILVPLITSAKSIASMAPAIWATKQTASSFARYLFSLRRQLERVIEGLMLAPLIRALTARATMAKAETWPLVPPSLELERKPKVNMNMASISQKNVKTQGCLFMALKMRFSQLSRTDCLRAVRWGWMRELESEATVRLMSLGGLLIARDPNK